jgi:hypothetical protein
MAGWNYRGALATPIDRNAAAYHGLDLNEIFLVRLAGAGFDFLCALEAF